MNVRTTPSPYLRESGSGPAVVCLHANASSSAQWRGLMDTLAPRFRVLAPDLYGAGKSVEWPSDRLITLQDEVDFIEPVLAVTDSPVALVGHSYGGAVALIAALSHPDRVSALVVYEPTLFAVIDAHTPWPNDADGIRDVVIAAGDALDAGDPDRVAEVFIDYWMGPGSWASTPEPRRPAIAASVVNVRRWGHALFTEPTALEAFRAIECPVLYLTGERTTASARGVAWLLTTVLPHVETVEFEGLGHMGPVTDPEPVNQAVSAFLLTARPPVLSAASVVGQRPARSESNEGGVG